MKEFGTKEISKKALYIVIFLTSVPIFFLLFEWTLYASEEDYLYQPRLRPFTNSTIFLIHVFIPHYKNIKFLQLSLNLLKMRESHDAGHRVQYTVFTQEETQEERNQVRKLIGNAAEVIDMPQPEKKGGAALLLFFKKVGIEVEKSNADIAVTVDVDALTLASNWDLKLLKLFKERNIYVAGISPRFPENVEWNWMAFSAKFFIPHLKKWETLDYYDWGHWFTAMCNKKQYLWNKIVYPIEHRSPTVIGDDHDMYWAIHFFYSTRKSSEKLVDEEKSYLATEEEVEKIVKWASSDPLPNMKEYFSQK